MPRPSWDQYFMLIAKTIALRGTCDRKRVGAVIVSNAHHIISTGYNGSPPGWQHCDDSGHELVSIEGHDSCVRTIHAEENALLHAAKHGVAVACATIYCTAMPCYDCIKRLSACGISSIYYAEAYKSARSGQNIVPEHDPAAGMVWRGMMFKQIVV